MRARRVVACLAAVVCAVGAAACGSSNSSSSSSAASTSSAAGSGSAAAAGSATTIDSSKPPVTLALISFELPGSSLLPEFEAAANGAAKIINSEGGFGGRKLVIDPCNSMLNPAAATICAHKTLASHPIAMLGCELTWYASGLPLYAAQHTPSMNCLNGPQDVTNKYSFGLQSSAVGEDRGLMRYLCAKSDVKSVTSLLPISPQFQTVIAPVIKQTLAGCGKTSNILFFPLTSVDVDPYVVKALGFKPSFIFLSTIGSQVDSFYKSFQQNNWPASKTAAPDTDLIPSTTGPAGSLINGAYVQGQFSTGNSSETSPDLATFNTALDGNTTYTNDPNVAWIYSETMLIYNAAKAIGFDKFTPQALQQWLTTTNGFPLPLSHNIVNPGPKAAPQIKQPYVRIEQWQSGKFVPTTAGPNKDGWISGW